MSNRPVKRHLVHLNFEGITIQHEPKTGHWWLITEQKDNFLTERDLSVLAESILAFIQQEFKEANADE